MKLGSLFDGSGGFPLAGAMCGIEPVWASEVEPYPIAVTKSRFPNMKHLGNVCEINGAEIKPVDIITFGSPCQDLSVAGKRAGLKHEDNGDDETTRSGLFMEAVRIIKEMREATNGRYPTYAVWENVPGAFSSNGGEDFRTVLEELIRIAEPSAVMPDVPKGGWAYADWYMGDGWSIAYRVLDAQYWGVPQRRRRIYLVLDLGGERAGKILFERESVRGYFETGRTPWQGTTADAQRCAGADDREGAGDAVGIDGYNGDITGDKAATLGVNCDRATGRNGVLCYDARGTRGNGDGAVCNTITGDHENCVTDYTSVVVEPCPIHDQATRISGKRGDKSDGKGNGLGIGDPGDPMNTLISGDRHAVAYAVGNGQADQTDLHDIPGALNCMHDQQAVLVGTNTPPHPRYIVRRLTPTECARLQGFPDRWEHPDHKEDLPDEEYEFWCKVNLEYAVMQGIARPDGNGWYEVWREVKPDSANGEDFAPYWENTGKPYTHKKRRAMLAWYNKLHTDSAEYKMWGNGIALPTALYVMQGIAEEVEVQNDGRTDRNMG